MATLISIATGNYLDASSWAVADATSLSRSESANTALTTSYVASSSSTPGVITVDGIAVEIASRNASPTGTISVELYNASLGASVAGTEVTINVSDLPPCSTTDINGGWILFKFSSPVLLLAATNYQVRAKTSSSSQVNLFSTATSNWSRMLRTTTTQAPTTGDDMYVMGEHTGAGTGNSFVITMNETAATDYGSNTTSLVTPALGICQRGTLSYGTASSTNYVLRLSGHLIVYNNGTLNIGTVATAIPRNSTAVLEFDCAADGGFGGIFRPGSDTTVQGLSRTSGKNFTWCLLNTDEAVNSTSLGVDTDTGWLDNDQIVVASTTRTFSQTEIGALNGDAGASALTVDGFGGAGGGLANAHGGGGTTDVIAEVINLTRNVRIRSVTSTAVTFFSTIYGTSDTSGTFDIDWCEFYYLGENGTSKKGIELGFGSLDYCSIHDTEDGALYLASATSSSPNTIQNCVFYNCSTVSLTSISINVPITGSHVFSDNVILRCANVAATPALGVSTHLVTFERNRIASCAASNNVNDFAINITANIGVLVMTSCVIHSNQSIGFYLSSAFRMKLVSCKMWRNNSYDIHLEASLAGASDATLFLESCTFFGANSRSIACENTFTGQLFIDALNCSFNSDSSFTVQAALELYGSTEIHLRKCTFSTVVAHASADILLQSGNHHIYSYGSTFAATTEWTTTASVYKWNSFIKSNNHDGSLGSTKSQYLAGALVAESTNRHTASGYAWKVTPRNASLKMIYPGPTEMDTLKAAVNASSAVTVNVYVLKDAAYNGNVARLVLAGGVIEGIDSDVVDSYSKTQKTITGATNATPIEVTATSHGYSTGDRVLVEGVVGNTAANGMWTVTSTGANTFTLDTSVGNGAYSSGGTANVYEQLSVSGTPTDAGVIEFYIDCDGTAGSIYIDDVSISQ